MFYSQRNAEVKSSSLAHFGLAGPVTSAGGRSNELENAGDHGIQWTGSVRQVWPLIGPRVDPWTIWGWIRFGSASPSNDLVINKNKINENNKSIKIHYSETKKGFLRKLRN